MNDDALPRPVHVAAKVTANDGDGEAVAMTARGDGYVGSIDRVDPGAYTARIQVKTGTGHFTCRRVPR